MIKDFKLGEYVTRISYELAFDDGRNNGFGFPCDENGNVKITNEGAAVNYAYCMAHPEKFKRWNKVVKHEYSYRENNSGTCECGERIELYNQYMGACQCPNCGQWYNLHGQYLKDPSEWEDLY